MEAWIGLFLLLFLLLLFGGIGNAFDLPDGLVGFMQLMAMVVVVITLYARKDSREKRDEENNELERQKQIEECERYNDMMNYIQQCGITGIPLSDHQRIEKLYAYCQLISNNKFKRAMDMFYKNDNSFISAREPSRQLPSVTSLMSDSLVETRLIVQEFSPYKKRCAFAYGKNVPQPVIIPWFVMIECGFSGLRKGQLLWAAVEPGNDAYVARKIEAQDPFFDAKNHIFGDWKIQVDISGIDDMENITVWNNNNSRNVHEVRFFNRENRVFLNIFSQKGPYAGVGKVLMRVDQGEPFEFEMEGINNSLVQSDEALHPLLRQLQGGQRFFIRHSFNGWFEEGSFNIAGVDNALALFAGRLRTGEDRPVRVPRSLMTY